jgi:hypothetical protein
MATEQDYATGTAAAEAVIQADMAKYPIPNFVKSMITPDEIAQASAQLSKAIIDAVDAEHANDKPEQPK